jgi:hypothetical protein
MKFKMNGTELELKGNEVSGDTYENRQWLKNKMDGEWDAEKKVWKINASRLSSFLDQKPWLIIEEKETEPKSESMSEKTEGSPYTQGLRSLATDGSLPSEKEMLEQIWNETRRAEALPYGRN